MSTKRKVISQREARQLRRRVEQLGNMIQRQRAAYAELYPGGAHLGHVSWEGVTHVASAVYTASILGHAVVATANGKHGFNLYAIPHKDMPV